MKRSINNTKEYTGKSPAREEPGSRNIISSPLKSRIDAGLAFIVFILICFGMIMLFSASMTEGFATEGNPSFFVSRQLIFTIVGSAAAIFIAFFIPLKLFDNIYLTVIIYIVTTLLLLMVFIPSGTPFVRGVELNGARRWLNISGFQIQPSEVAKIALVFCFAGYTSWVSKKREQGCFVKNNFFTQAFFDGFIDVVLPALAIGVWVIIIFLQPHISWIVIAVLLSFFLFFSARLSFKSLFAGTILLFTIAGALLLLINIILPVLPDNISYYVDYNYVTTRIAIFMAPESVSEDAFFQTQQSINAIGSGGLTGVGIGNSIQKWGYLPMQYNDYVYSIIAEELGFIGALSVIFLFIAYFVAGIKIALKASDTFASIIAFGFSLLIILQALLNIGVATNVIPPTGISLPFFSYGGSSTTFSLIGIGLLLCVSKSGTGFRRKKG